MTVCLQVALPETDKAFNHKCKLRLLPKMCIFLKNALLKKLGLRLKTFSDPESGTLSILVLFIWTSVNRKCAKY